MNRLGEHYPNGLATVKSRIGIALASAAVPIHR